MRYIFEHESEKSVSISKTSGRSFVYHVDQSLVDENREAPNLTIAAGPVAGTGAGFE